MSNTKIRWNCRYSTTMDDDDRGRWARVGVVGDFDNIFRDQKAAVFQVCWIDKLVVGDNLKFTVKPEFPYGGPHSFDSLESAQTEIESRFNFFLDCIGR